MMKRFSLLLGLCLLFGWIEMSGQEHSGSWKGSYCVSYIQKQELRRSGNRLYVVKLDMECPERMKGCSLQPLHAYICKKLFHIEEASLQAGCRQFLDNKGVRLNAFPKDDGLETNYVTCSLKELAYDERGYMSLQLFYLNDPKDASAKANIYQELITYDMVNERVLTVTDILNTRQLDFLEVRLALAEMLFYQAYGTADIDFGDLAFTLDACLVPNGVMFGFVPMGLEKQFQQQVVLSAEEIGALLTKDAKRLLRGEMKPQKSKTKQALNAFVTEDTDESLPDSLKIYTAVDEMPSFQFGGQGIAPYISTRMMLPDDVQSSGKAVVSFVVEKEGTLSDFSILQPISPAFDRELVRVLRNMPAWKPGLLQGKPVRVRLIVPISLQAG